MQRETHRLIQVKIDKVLSDIVKWIEDVQGKDHDKAINFIKTYFHHLNDNTKRSMYEYILDLTDTRLREPNQLNDLMLLVEDLLKIKKEKDFN